MDSISRYIEGGGKGNRFTFSWDLTSHSPSRCSGSQLLASNASILSR